MNKKIKFLFLILIGIIFIGGATYLYLYFSSEKKIKLLSPNGGDVLRAGTTYQIKWKSNRIGKIGIMLIEDDSKESRWIVKDFPANKQKYDWQIFVWEKTRQDYKIAIFEYPWVDNNKIDYSDNVFTIVGPKFVSCDELSINAEFPYIPSDFPDLRRAFITKKSFNGNLEGLDGADKKCQQEAEEQELNGEWKAFLGDDSITAIDRLNLTGIFVEAPGIGVLPQDEFSIYNFWRNFGKSLEKIKKEEERNYANKSYQIIEQYINNFVKKWAREQDKKTCYRLLGRNFDEFFKKFSNLKIINQEKLEEKFFSNLSNLWLGRINSESKKDCITLLSPYMSSDLSRNYSYTVTCQNWKNDQEIAEKRDTEELPICYDPQGKRINVVGIGGLSSWIIDKEEKQRFIPNQGKSCNQEQKLLCIEQ